MRTARTSWMIGGFAAVFLTGGCGGMRRPARSDPVEQVLDMTLGVAVEAVGGMLEREHRRRMAVHDYANRPSLEDLQAPDRPIPEPPPPRDPLRSFDANAARTQLAAMDLSECRAHGLPVGYVRVSLKLASHGRPLAVVIEQPRGLDEPAHGCVRGILGTMTVPPFSGDPVYVSRTWFVAT